MFESNSKFPKIFIYILISLSVLIFAGMFFHFKVVEIFYFIAILVMVVFFMLDKKYGKSLTNHKAVFLLFDFINLIAVIAILYYEYSKHNPTLNAFLIALICILAVHIVIDFVFISDKFSVRKEFLLIDLFELSSMICNLTYFNKVSEFWFAIVATVLFSIVLGVKIVVTIKLKYYSKDIVEQKETTKETGIEKIINTNDEQGEVE